MFKFTSTLKRSYSAATCVNLNVGPARIHQKRRLFN